MTAGPLYWSLEKLASQQSPVTYHPSLQLSAGVGGWSGAIVSGGLNAKDGTGALGFLNAMADLPKYTTKGGMLYVFSLP